MTATRSHRREPRCAPLIRNVGGVRAWDHGHGVRERVARGATRDFCEQEHTQDVGDLRDREGSIRFISSSSLYLLPLPSLCHRPYEKISNPCYLLLHAVSPAAEQIIRICIAPAQPTAGSLATAIEACLAANARVCQVPSPKRALALARDGAPEAHRVWVQQLSRQHAAPIIAVPSMRAASRAATTAAGCADLGHAARPWLMVDLHPAPLRPHLRLSSDDSERTRDLGRRNHDYDADHKRGCADGVDRAQRPGRSRE